MTDDSSAGNGSGRDCKSKAIGGSLFMTSDSSELPDVPKDPEAFGSERSEVPEIPETADACVSEGPEVPEVPDLDDVSKFERS